MSGGDMEEQLKFDLEKLAAYKGLTVPETVESVKRETLAQGADPETVAEFFRQMDEIAQLHIY